MNGDRSKFTQSEFRKLKPRLSASNAWKSSKENWMIGHIISVKRVRVRNQKTNSKWQSDNGKFSVSRIVRIVIHQSEAVCGERWKARTSS